MPDLDQSKMGDHLPTAESSAAPMASSRSVDYPAIVEFVRKRRQATGGYSATPRLPATVEDTFEAVAILLDISERGFDLPKPPGDDDALACYLGRVLAAPWLAISTTFRMLLSCRSLDLAIDVERVRSHVAACLAREPSLATVYYVARIAVEILAIKPRELLGGRQPVPLPARYAVDDMHRYLAVQNMLNEQPVDSNEIVDWLQRSQNGDGGFGFFPGTTSFIENCHAGLAALTLLAAVPVDLVNARAFIVSCQTGAGGFSRNLRAAPFLESTWHAVASLRLLEKMP
ncbi:MAG: hypothetical protein A2511_13995 [Deltaproteobacteria bacterium RIFOXYD12_FULL_50_9]|nr:MAG: hypothetical protein A2511_13995 [Deltaproteobacteria bacterium RIFOXYD12_FULL_50_9]